MGAVKRCYTVMQFCVVAQMASGSNVRYSIKFGGSGNVLGIWRTPGDRFEAINPDGAIEMYPGSGDSRSINAAASGIFDRARDSLGLRKSQSNHGARQKASAGITGVIAAPYNKPADDLNRLGDKFDLQTIRCTTGTQCRLLFKLHGGVSTQGLFVVCRRN